MKAAFQTVFRGTVDRASGIIEGVSIVTMGTAQGHGLLIDLVTLTQVAELIGQFESGCKVKAEHGKGFTGIVGRLENPRVVGTKVKADLHLIKSHPQYEWICDMAEQQPDTFGLSISFSGVPEVIDGQRYARVTELYSTDLVDSPAANPDGLFEITITSTKGEDDMWQLSDIKTAITEAFGEKITADELRTSLEALAPKVEELTTELQARNEKVASLETDVVALRASKTELETKVTDLTSALEAAKAAVTEFEAKVQKAASAKALEITAAQGQPPIPQGGTAAPGDTKTDLSHLKGLDRTKAAFEAQPAIAAYLKQLNRKH